MSSIENIIKKNSDKRILVTGAAGFIGRQSLPLLLSHGFEVHAADIFVPDERLFGVSWHKVDLLDAKSTYNLIETVQPTHLLHFAWYAKPGDFWNSDENYRWLDGSLNLLHQFQIFGGERVVMAGTCAEYDWQYGLCSEDSTHLNPITVYGKCKNSLHNLLSEFSDKNGLSYAWGRLFFLYGPYENPERLVASFINSLLKAEIAHCINGDLIRDYLHVQDAASAFVSLLASRVKGPVNIGSGQPVALKDLLNMIGEKLDKKELTRFGKASASSNQHNLVVADVKRLINEVGWKPQYNLNQGLDQTIDWWKNYNLNIAVLA